MVFTIYQIVNGALQKVYQIGLLSRAPVHTRNIALEVVSVPEQNFSAPLLKVERFVSDRLSKRSESRLNTLLGAEVATESCTGK